MSFHPNYYLNGLNLEYDEDTTNALSNNNNHMFSPSSSGNHDLITEEDIQQHLDLFSGAANEFYSLDVIGDNTVVPMKPVQQHPHQPQYKESFATPNHPQTVNVSVPPAQDIAFTANTATIPSPHSVASTPYTPSVYTNAPAATVASGAAGTLLSSSHSSLEDKKKRNTAASARFRIKKKLKEQEMERKARELEEKVAALEKKLKTMEMENKCLKSIIFQQNEQKNIDVLESIKRKSILDSKSNFEYTV